MTTVYSERIDGWTCELYEDVSIRQAVQDVTGIVATARPDGSLQAYALVPPTVLAWLLKPLFADLEATVEGRVRRELAGKASSILRELSQDMGDAASLIEREWATPSTSLPETAGEKESL